MKLTKAFVQLVLVMAAFAGPSQADPFTAGDLVVSCITYSGASSDVQGQIFLDEFKNLSGPTVIPVQSIALPSSTTGDTGISTSFASKSEGALTLSVDGRFLTYMGYQAQVGIPSISNSFTSAAPDNSPGPYYNREVARIDSTGNTVLQPINNAYSGDNPRAVISVDGTQFYMAGNSGNTTLGTIGARYDTLGSNTSILLGTVNSSPSKSDNFRAVTIYNGNFYLAKGSGGNGNDGIFQVGTGLPTTAGGQIITALPGLSGPADSTAFPYHPFGFFFANDNTLYVADEGTGSALNSVAGLEKWAKNAGTWTLEYILQNGLGQAGVTGLRNMTAKVNGDVVTIYAITAQVGEADPTSLVTITDALTATSLPADESFDFLATSGANEVFRGVAMAPVPLPGTFILLTSGLGFLIATRRRFGR